LLTMLKFLSLQSFLKEEADDPERESFSRLRLKFKKS
jgi:hypothetical protein